MTKQTNWTVYIEKDPVTGYSKSASSVMRSSTGRRLYFKQYPNDYTGKWGYSSTEMKNYPVQSLATGDIVPLMLGKIFDLWKHHPAIKLVNTVHDSILFDTHEDITARFILDIKEVLSKTHLFFEHDFKAPLPLKLEAGVSYGRNWYEMEEIEL